MWVETIGFGLKFYPHQSFLGRAYIDIVNNTDTLSGRLLVLVRQQTAIRTLRTVGEVSALGDSVCAQTEGAGASSRDLGKPWLPLCPWKGKAEGRVFLGASEKTTRC